MSDTNVRECNCCQIETDCIEGLCELCLSYNLQQTYRLQKQVDLLTLGLLHEKRLTAYMRNKINDILVKCNHNNDEQDTVYFVDECLLLEIIENDWV